MSVVAEVVGNPLVDGREGDFRLTAGFHRHADEVGVRIGRLDVWVGLVVDVLCERRWCSHGVVRRLRGGGGDRLAGSMGTAHARWVAGQG